MKFLLACDHMDNIYKMNTTSISPAADFVVLVDVAHASDWADGSRCNFGVTLPKGPVTRRQKVAENAKFPW